MIVYAEITIHKEEVSESVLDYFNRVINELPKKTNDTIVILFDDGTIVDTKKCEDCVKITRGHKFPIYFEIGKSIFFKALLFETQPDTFVGKEVIDSIYNCNYYTLDYNIDAFAITRIKSSDKSPRFSVAYNDTYFEKSHVIYLVNSIINEVKN